MSGNDDGEGGTERLCAAAGPEKRTMEAASAITDVISAEARGMINGSDWYSRVYAPPGLRAIGERLNGLLKSTYPAACRFSGIAPVLLAIAPLWYFANLQT
jgi:hypothetical protein